MKVVEAIRVEALRARLSRRVGPSFADMAIAADAAYGYPDGWGTSPRRAPSPAKAYKPAHGGADIIAIPMTRWHLAVDDQGPSPLRAA